MALLSLTFSRPMSLTTGAVMDVMMSSTVATSNKKVPMWWKKPVTAMLSTGVLSQETLGSWIWLFIRNNAVGTKLELYGMTLGTHVRPEAQESWAII